MFSFAEEDLIELELLRDQEIDSLVENQLLPPQERWNMELRDGFTFSYPEVVVEITTGHPYPVGLPTYQVVNRTMPATVVDKLRIVLRGIIERDSRSNTLEKWIARTTRDDLACFEFEMIVLHVAAETFAQVQEYRTYLKDVKAPTQSLSPETNLLNQDQSGDSCIGPDSGVDLSSIEGHSLVHKLLQQKPEQICAKVPKHFRILHVETVLRDDLYANFRAQQQSIRRDLMDKSVNSLRESVAREIQRPLSGRDRERILLVDHLIRPRLTFHGTLRESVPSIVRHGFLLPGDRNPLTTKPVEVRCGNTYGRGIYSSPSLEFSLRYSPSSHVVPTTNQHPGIKLIICATVMGIAATMKRDDDWRMIDHPFSGAHSHVDFFQNEYIVFNRAQILPCYVIHLLDLSRAKSAENPQAWISPQTILPNKKLNPDDLAPGDKQRAKELMIGKAAKYFPYGYGPAIGTLFVVEEVGDVDEDEEDYGMYQEDRIDKVKDRLKGGGNVWMWDENDQFDYPHDEYSAAR